MKEFQNMKNSVQGDDPLSREIVIFKKKREQANMIEQIFRNIKANYAKTNIDQMKGIIDKKLSQPNPVYNTVPASNYFNRIKSELSNKAFQSPELQNQIINEFKGVDESVRFTNRSASPAINIVSNPMPTGMSIGNPLPSPTGAIISRPIQPSAIPIDVRPVSIKTPQPAIVMPQEQRLTQNGRNTPSRSERGGKTVTFDTRLSPSKSTGQLIPGKQPVAKVSPDMTEVQVNYRVSNPQLTHLKNINLSHLGGVPVTLKTLDDRNLAIGCADGALKVMDTTSSVVAKQFKFNSPIRVIECVDDDGHSKFEMGVLVGLGAPDNAIALIDLAENDAGAVEKFRGHTGEVSGIITLGDGQFVSCGFDGNVIKWNMDNPANFISVKAHVSKINSIATLNSNTTLVSGGDDCMIRVYAIVPGGELQLRGSMREAAQVSHVSSFHGNSRFVVSCLLNGSIRIWNVESGE